MADKLFRALHLGEDFLAYLSLLLLSLLPFLEVLARKFFHTGVPNSTVYVQHLVLIATFLAGAVTSRQKKHLTLTVDFSLKKPMKTIIHVAVQVTGAAIAMAFAWSSLSFALNGFDPAQKIGPFPLRFIALIMFIGYLIMAVRFISPAADIKRRGVWLALAAVCGSTLAFPSIIQIYSALWGAPPAFLTGLQEPLQALLTRTSTPLIIFLVVSALFGSPIFIILGGVGYLLFARGGLPLEVVPNQAYAMLTTHSIAAIPLFTITGFLLSESKAGERLIKLMRVLFSWFPGGLAIMAVVVCAFFTTFTGASGVTIVALGGLLFYILTNAGYGRRFSIGLLTASGSIGLLFPPSLPVIIYGVTAQINIKEMFKGGVVPGLLLVLTMVIIGIAYALRIGVERSRFSLPQTFTALRETLWEILIPIIIFIGYFGVPLLLVKRFAAALVLVLTLEALMRTEEEGGRRAGARPAVFVPITAAFAVLLGLSSVSWLGIGIASAVSMVYGYVLDDLVGGAPKLRRRLKRLLSSEMTIVGLLVLLAVASSVTLTLVESAAVTVVYALFIQVVVRRDLKIKDLPAAMNKCLPIIGGVLTILALANGLSYYIIDAEIPTKLAAWVQAAISSKYVFLLILNGLLIIVGCFMDIYSAILVVVPLILPLGALFQIHPVHLGIIFLANMELGYLTPPVGLNLYLSSYRFNEPMIKVYRDVQVFLYIRFVVVLLITYLPLLTTALLAK